MNELTTVDAVLDAIAKGREFEDEEDLDTLAHMLQTAALLAESAPDDFELQAAGLVHDLGWLLAADAPHHARVGGDAVRGLLGDRVAALVGGHDHAKRYLVSCDPEYRALLSEMSVATLALQGGDMDDAEQKTFEAEEHFESLVTLRRADDAAKVPGRAVPELEHWRPLLEQLAGR
ncbi:MAG: metal-dependent phosphohydrolase [Actinobacteria bacterium]|nr:metal-dependent phosphohydrolase [Actinomycetota bacterium]